MKLKASSNLPNNKKYTFRTWLLRLGLNGDEFATARKHLLANLPGCIAWRDPAQAEAQKERLRKKREKEMAERQERSAGRQMGNGDLQASEHGTAAPMRGELEPASIWEQKAAGEQEEFPAFVMRM